MKKTFTLLASTVVMLLAFGLIWHSVSAAPVLLAPLPQFYATDNSGRPLAFGCVSTFVSGTTTPLATYTDSSGTTQNTNPVILSASGNANIWIQAGQAYTFRVKSAGGSNCSSGTTRYTVNGIGGGSSQLSTNVSSSATPQFTAIAQNQLFLFTLSSNTVSLPLVVNNVQPPSLITFEITQNGTGFWTFAWPANVIGGGIAYGLPGAISTQQFFWDGTNARAVGPMVSGQAAGGGPNLTSLDVVGPAHILGQTTLSGGFSFNGTNFVSSLQGTGGSALATTFGSFTNGDLVCVGTLGTFEDCGFSKPVLLNLANTAGGSASANTSLEQTIQSTSFVPNTLNALGHSFRVTIYGVVSPVASVNSQFDFGFGASSTLSATASVAAQSLTNDSYQIDLIETCVVRATGPSGTIRCMPLANVTTNGAGNAAKLPQYVDFTGLDLTSTLFVGAGTKFTSASASNVATTSLFVLEQLN